MSKLTRSKFYDLMQGGESKLNPGKAVYYVSTDTTYYEVPVQGEAWSEESIQLALNDFMCQVQL